VEIPAEMKKNNQGRSAMTWIGFGSIIFLVAAFAPAQETSSPVKSFRHVALSPDGTQVAWVETGAKGDGTAIYVQDLKSSTARPRRLSAAGEGSAADEGDACWSPDGKQVAFLSDAGSEGQSQLYVVSADGGAARKVTNLKGFLADPAWSPDGKTIAVLFTEDAPRAAGPLMPMTPET
jgi:Tol biopolymer transport system component